MPLIIVLSMLLSTAQTTQTPAVVITGRVMTGAPPHAVPGAVITAAGASAVADLDGHFTISITQPAASVHLIVSAPGFLEQDADVAVVSGRGAVEVLLRANTQYREDVTVSGTGGNAGAAPSALPLTPAEILGVAGAVDNVFRVLQTLPGVSATDEFGSRLTVRGGGPDQNLTVMDGVEIHNPYRLFGLTSAFNPETVERFELTAGGFGPQYGDRLSSLLTIDNRAGTRARPFAATTSLSVTDANIVTEGRLPHGSWLVTGRRTYYDLFAERVTDSDLPSFGDLQSKVVWEMRPGHQLSFFGLRSRESTNAEFEGNIPADRLGLKDLSTNDVLSLTYGAALGRRATTRTVAAYYRYGDDLDVDGSVENQAERSNAPVADYGRSAIVFRRSLVVRDVSLRSETNVAIGSRQTLAAGFEGHALRTSWGWHITGDRNANQPNGSSIIGGAGLPDLLDSHEDVGRIGAWLEDDVRISARLRAAGGARLEWNGLTQETLASPRGRVTFDLAAGTRLRAAVGRYTQSPGYEKLLQADYFVDLSNTRSLGLTSERSTHYITGLERDLGRGLSARVEGYFKSFDDLVLGRLETPDETAARVAQYDFPPAIASSVPSAPQITTVPGNVGSGHAYGADVFLEKRAQSSSDRLAGWVSYTWGHATIDAYGRSYPFDYDRRHAFSLVTSWRASNRIRLAATFRAASGFPDTWPAGVRVGATEVPGESANAPTIFVPQVEPATGLYVWTIDYGGVERLNTSRLPTFARLDIRATYQHRPTSRWQIYLEVINALDRDNAGQLTPELRYDPNSDRPAILLSPDGGLPRLPTFGVRVRF